MKSIQLLKLENGEIDPEMGPLLREARESAGLSLEDIATQTGWTITYISELERKKKPIGLPHCQGMSKAIGIKLDEICEPGKEILPVEISDDQRGEYSRRLVAKMKTLREMEEDRATIVASFRKEHQMHRAEIEDIYRVLDSGKHDIPVDVEWVNDHPEPGKKSKVRKDDGAVLETMDMSGDDLNLKLNLQE